MASEFQDHLRKLRTVPEAGLLSSQVAESTGDKVSAYVQSVVF